MAYRCVGGPREQRCPPARRPLSSFWAPLAGLPGRARPRGTLSLTRLPGRKGSAEAGLRRRPIARPPRAHPGSASPAPPPAPVTWRGRDSAPPGRRAPTWPAGRRRPAARPGRPPLPGAAASAPLPPWLPRLPSTLRPCFPELKTGSAGRAAAIAHRARGGRRGPRGGAGGGGRDPERDRGRPRAAARRRCPRGPWGGVLRAQRGWPCRRWYLQGSRAWWGWDGGNILSRCCEQHGAGRAG